MGPQRIAQLDSLLLESEQVALLKSELIGFVSPYYFYKYEPEISGILEAIVLSQMFSGSTIGSRLQNIKYTSSSTTKLYFILLSIFGKWIYKRMPYFAASKNLLEHPDYLILDKIFQAYKVFDLMNYLAFLHKGKFRSLLERLLNFELGDIMPNSQRVLFYDFMNRQLLWNTLNQFYEQFSHLNILEKLNGFVRPFKSLRKVTREKADGVCVICEEERITVKYQNECGHVYCYLCVANLSNCPSCNSFLKLERTM